MGSFCSMFLGISKWGVWYHVDPQTHLLISYYRTRLQKAGHYPRAANTTRTTKLLVDSANLRGSQLRSKCGRKLIMSLMHSHILIIVLFVFVSSNTIMEQNCSFKVKAMGSHHLTTRVIMRLGHKVPFNLWPPDKLKELVSSSHSLRSLSFPVLRITGHVA